MYHDERIETLQNHRKNLNDCPDRRHHILYHLSDCRRFRHHLAQSLDDDLHHPDLWSVSCLPIYDKITDKAENHVDDHCCRCHFDLSAVLPAFEFSLKIITMKRSKSYPGSSHIANVFLVSNSSGFVPYKTGTFIL